MPGAVVVTAGLVSLVYGFTKAASDGWGSAATLGFVAAGVVLLAAFVVVELRSATRRQRRVYLRQGTCPGDRGLDALPSGHRTRRRRAKERLFVTARGIDQVGTRPPTTQPV